MENFKQVRDGIDAVKIGDVWYEYENYQPYGEPIQDAWEAGTYTGPYTTRTVDLLPIHQYSAEYRAYICTGYTVASC